MNRKFALVAAGVLATSFALPMQASAELEELQVHGQVRIRGNYLDPGFDSTLAPGVTTIGFDDDHDADDFYNALAEVNFTADMSDDVSAYIAVRSYDIWGLDSDDSVVALSDEDANPTGEVTAAGILAGAGNDNIDLYQAYIRMDNVGGYPVALVLGRQELAYGREFILGNNDAGVNFPGLAYDALRVSYDNDENFRVDAFLAKLVETRTLESDGDVDLYGVYGTYYGLEMLDIDAYYILVDAAIQGGARPSTKSDVHTLGGRVYGSAMDDALTYNVEVAYQFGDVGNLISGAPGAGDSDVEAWSINAMAGYTFADVSYTPEVHVEYAYFTGDDDSLDSDFEQFSRLFSDVHYGKINLGGNLDENATNMHIFRVGGSVQATDTLSLHGDWLLFILAEDDINALDPGVGAAVFGASQGGVTGLESDDGAGSEVDLWAELQYSEDLKLSAGWSHFFADDAEENAFGNDDDLDYLWWEATLVF